MIKEYKNRIEYYNNSGELHREDGPAIIYNDIEYYYLNDVYYTEEQYKEKLIEIKLKRIISIL